MFVKKARIWLRGFASKFSTDSNAKQLHERNRLRFIFITSSVGGAMLGYGLAQIFQTPKCKKEEIQITIISTSIHNFYHKKRPTNA
jgi:hypothetical protein